MHRRTFLAAAGSIAVASAVQAERANAPRNGLGFSLYGMKSMRVPEAIKACADIGYDCVELPVMPGWPAESRKQNKDTLQTIKSALGDHGVRMSAIMETASPVGN